MTGDFRIIIFIIIICTTGIIIIINIICTTGIIIINNIICTTVSQSVHYSSNTQPTSNQQTMPSTKRSISSFDTTDIIVKCARYEITRATEAVRKIENAVRAHKENWKCVMVQVQIMNLYPRPENVRKYESEHMGHYTSHIEYDLPKARYYVLQRTLTAEKPFIYDIRFKSTWETRKLMDYLKNPPACICPVYRAPKSYCKKFGGLKITYL